MIPLVGHVADAVDVDQEADAGDHQQQNRRERVQREAPADVQLMAAPHGAQRHPGGDLGFELPGLRGKLCQLPHRSRTEHQSGEHHGAGQPTDRCTGHASAEEAVDQHAD